MSTGRTSDGGSVLSGHVPKPGLLVGGRAFVCGGVPARTPTDRCPPREEGGGGDNDPELKTTPKDEKPAIGGGPRQAFLKRLPRSKPSRTTLYRSTYKIHPPGRQGPDVKVRRLPPRRRPGLRRNGYYIPCFIFTHNRWRGPARARFSPSAPRVGLVGRIPSPAAVDCHVRGGGVVTGPRRRRARSPVVPWTFSRIGGPGKNGVQILPPRVLDQRAGIVHRPQNVEKGLLLTAAHRYSASRRMLSAAGPSLRAPGIPRSMETSSVSSRWRFRLTISNRSGVSV